MSYSLTVTESGGLTLGLTGPAGPAGPTGATGGVTSVAGRTGPVTLVSADITDASTGGNGSVGDGGKLVKFNSDGGITTLADGDGYGVFASSSTGNGLIADSQDGNGALIASYSSNGINAISVAGTYHALFGSAGSDRSFIARVNGALGWFRNSNRTLTIEAAATLAASRTYIIPDATGTTVPIVPAYADLTAANAAALGAGTFFWNTALKKLQVTTA